MLTLYDTGHHPRPKPPTPACVGTRLRPKANSPTMSFFRDLKLDQLRFPATFRISDNLRLEKAEPYVAVVAGGCIVFLFGYALGKRSSLSSRRKRVSKALVAKGSLKRTNSVDSAATFSEPDSEHGGDLFRMVLVVRTDLKMGKAKIAGQCSRATLGEFKKLYKSKDANLFDWERNGQTCVVLRADSEEELMDLRKSAKKAGVGCHVVVDQGKHYNMKTAMAVGPAKTELVVELTRHLKLL